MLPSRITRWIEDKKNTFQNTLRYLYHEYDWNNLFEAALAPLFWFIDRYTKKLGTSFVILCCILMTCMAGISYWIGLPFWWERSPLTTVCLVMFGQYLLLNCAFYYYMGVMCGPGYPPTDTFYKEVASICKKCIQPKPYRTHHCSICNLCILQMDHHCPWLNNCVGHYNRRYFFMFMVYIEISVIFLIIFGVEIAYNELWLYYMPPDDAELYGYPVNVNISLPKDEWVIEPTRDETGALLSEEKYKSVRRRAVVFAAIVALGVAIAIGTLLKSHCKMVSRGETSIEKLINDTQAKKYTAVNQAYVNPYDFGTYKNWTIFLGIENGTGRTWIRHVLLPSAHKPFGDGIIFPTVYSSKADWKNFFHYKEL